MGSRPSVPFASRADTITCEAEWRPAFVSDVKRVASSVNLPSELWNIIIGYIPPTVDAILDCVKWGPQIWLNQIPKHRGSELTRAFQWRRSVIMPDSVILKQNPLQFSNVIKALTNQWVFGYCEHADQTTTDTPIGKMYVCIGPTCHHSTRPKRLPSDIIDSIIRSLDQHATIYYDNERFPSIDPITHRPTGQIRSVTYWIIDDPLQPRRASLELCFTVRFDNAAFEC